MPYKISMWIVIFLLFFNGGAALMNTSGASDYLGVSPDVCAPDSLQNAGETSQGFSTGGGGGSTLFGFYNQIAGMFETLFNSIFPGAAMLKCAGIPDYVVTFAFSGLAVVPGIDIAIFLRRG